jgi:uncharacterized protein involved in outer membrane biogenesis
MSQDETPTPDAPAAPPQPAARRLRRLVLGAAIVLVLLVVVLVGGGYALLRTADLASLAASRISAALGRTVVITSLHVVPGRWLAVEIEGLTIPSLPGGSGPAMVTLRRAATEIDVLSLLRGPPQIRNAVAEGLAVLLERTADRTPNWRFHPRQATAPSTPKPDDRTGFPSLRTVRLTDIEVVYRTTSGNRLVSHLDQAAIDATADDQPIRLTGAGAYNGTPVSIDADLGSLIAYRDAATPFPATVHMVSGDVAVRFEGAMTDPLNVDGMKGTLTLDAESPAPVFAMAGVKSTLDAALHLTGDFERQGDVWTLSDAFGALNDDSIMVANLRLVEGASGKPDDVTAQIEFDSLNLNNLIGAGPRGKRSGADMPLTVDQAPDTLVKATLAAREVLYGDFTVNDASIQASIAENRVAVDDLALTIFGTRVKASGSIEAAGEQGRVTAELAATGGDVQTLRRRLGFGAVPLTGKLDGQFAVAATGAALNEAIRTARISAVVTLRGGGIMKEVIEMASTDVRALFRANKGMTPVSCLLAGLDIRAGAGTLAPLRVRAAEGTIAGSAKFDLNRKTMDLTIGSESRTTGVFALDIPVRVSGSFGNPDIRPAKWSPQGRALLAAADDLSQLPPALQAMARRHPCPPSAR